MRKKQIGFLLGALIFAAAAAGCGSGDPSSGKASTDPEVSKTEEASGAEDEKTEADQAREQGSGREEVVETSETFTYSVGSAELEMNLDLDTYLDSETNIFDMTKMARDLGFNEVLKEEGSFGVRMNKDSSFYSGTEVDILLSDRQEATDIDGEELTPYSVLTVSWKGGSEGSCTVTQEDVSQARYTIGRSRESVSYEMAILIACALSQECLRAGEDPYADLLSGAEGAYTISGTEELPADETEEFVEGIEEEPEVVIEDTTEQEEGPDE